jgi:hypothetical protein
MANIERVANLFITKTVWATLLAVAAGVTLLPYPFLPRDLTIIDTLAIGVPSFLPRARPELAALSAGVHRPRAALRHPRRGIIAAATSAAYALAHARSAAGAAAHGRNPGHPHPQPVRAGAACHPTDLAQDPAGRSRAGRLRAAVPGTGGAPLLRAAAAPQRARNHACHRSARRCSTRGFLGPLPPTWPRAAPGSASDGRKYPERRALTVADTARHPEIKSRRRFVPFCSPPPGTQRPCGCSQGIT